MALRIACLKVDIQTKPTIARFTHSPLHILSVDADVAHEQGKPVSVFIKSRRLQYTGASYANSECLSQSGYTDETYNCTLHSFTS